MIKPLKKLGQNFLIDKSVIRKLIKTADIKKTDVVSEIGPGLGAISKELAQKAKKLILVEKDLRMCQILEDSLRDFKNIQIIHKDILKYEPGIKEYKVVSNLPFYLTSHVIRKLLENKYPPKEMTLIIQKEVAQKISAKPPNMSFLAVSVQFYSKPKIVSYVPKEAFWPKPKIESAIIKIIKTESPETDKDLFFKIISAGFSQPRKKLSNNLSNKLHIDKKEIEKWLLKNNIDLNQRAQSLTMDDWVKLTNSLANNCE